MSKKTLRIGIIGAGARGTGSYVRYLPEFEPKAELTALAEPDEENAKKCLAMLDGRQVHAPSVYGSYLDMLDAEEFDGMIIATPDHLHRDAAVECIRRGISAIALEKPLAPTAGQCSDIVRAAAEAKTRIHLGFVLRSTPFYSSVRRLLDEGAVGRILSIQADERVSMLVTSIMLRSRWRRYRRYAGGSLLEKCCHDIDLLNLFAGARPVRVSSFGNRLMFGANPSLPDRCGDCPVEDCFYRCVRGEDDDSANRAMGEYLRDEDLCVYNTGTEGMDNQSVQVLYENDVVADFQMSFHCEGPRSDRNLHIIGSRGRIWGNLKDSEVCHYDNRSGKTDIIPCTSDSSGHYGGDREHMFAFLRCAADPSAQPTASVYDGYISAMVCFAADQSVSQSRQIGLDFSDDGLIELQ